MLSRRVDGIPKKLINACEASDEMTERVVPKVVKRSDGKGSKKKRNIMGNKVSFKVFMLKKNSIRPLTKIGRAIMWYSKGEKVWEPYQYMRRAIDASKTPINVCKRVLLSFLWNMTALKIFLFLKTK